MTPSRHCLRPLRCFTDFKACALAHPSALAGTCRPFRGEEFARRVVKAHDVVHERARPCGDDDDARCSSHIIGANLLDEAQI